MFARAISKHGIVHDKMLQNQPIRPSVNMIIRSKHVHNRELVQKVNNFNKKNIHVYCISHMHSLGMQSTISQVACMANQKSTCHIIAQPSNKDTSMKHTVQHATLPQQVTDTITITLIMSLAVTTTSWYNYMFSHIHSSYTLYTYTPDSFIIQIKHDYMHICVCTYMHVDVDMCAHACTLCVYMCTYGEV